MPPIIVPVSRMLNVQVSPHASQFGAIRDIITVIDNHHWCWKMREQHLFLDLDCPFASCAEPRLPAIETWFQAVQASKLIKDISDYSPKITSQQEVDIADIHKAVKQILGERGWLQ